MPRNEDKQLDNQEEQDTLMSRSAYRKHRDQETADFEARDKKRLEVERAYAEEQRAQHPEETYVKEKTTAKEKSRSLNKKLNRGIIIVVILELLVLGVLFFF